MTARPPNNGPLAAVELVRVGTLNPPKLAAVQGAFDSFVSGVKVVGAAVDSSVPEQPVGFDEIVAGARARAHAAFEIGACDLAVGIEDGLVVIPALGDDIVNVGAAVVTDGVRTSVGLSSGFPYPPACAQPAVQDRAPIGSLFDALMGASKGDAPSALGEGNIGRLTHGVLPRAEYGRHGVVCALIRFLHPHLYEEAAPVQSPPSDAPGRAVDAR